MWRKAMVYLGLGDDADYEDLPERADDSTRPEPRERPRQHAPSTSGVTAVSSSSGTASPEEPSGLGSVRTVGSRPGASRDATVSSVAVQGPDASNRPRGQVVRPIAPTPNAKPHVVAPETFNEAQDVADKFKASQPVIMNLQGADRDLARRLIDFASGLCYGIGGQMERVSNQVYLLTPTNVEVSQEERRRLHERGYDS